MTTVTTHGARHMYAGEVQDMIRERYGVREITDACAATIASWWQSPGAIGNKLATLASGLPVDSSELLEDIAATRREAGTMPADDSQALDMLATWAINGGEE